jgi:hypothetical protein
VNKIRFYRRGLLVWLGIMAVCFGLALRKAETT